MRYIAVVAVAVLTLFCGIALAGAGHGWNSGGLGGLALSPVSAIACNNALSPNPSPRSAYATLICGLLVCLTVIALTAFEGLEYLQGYFRAAGAFGVSAAVFVYAGWLLLSIASIVRARWAPRSGS